MQNFRTCERTHWQANVADTFAVIALIILTLYYLTGFRFDTLFSVPSRKADFGIYYVFPSFVFERLEYPLASGDRNNPFPYLPSAILMMLPISKLPLPIAFGIWILIQAASLALVLWAGLRLCGIGSLRGRWLIALIAVLMVELPISWDFRNHNNNAIYLAFVMLALTVRQNWLSGLLFAASINLKLYSGLLLVGFAWRREYRLAASLAIASIVLGVIFPIAAFGFPGYVKVMSGWLNELHYTTTHEGLLEAPATLLKSMAALLRTDIASPMVIVVLAICLGVWVTLVIGYFLLAAKPNVSPNKNGSKARLSDVCVLLMGPLPFSTRFSPYHAIVLLPAFLILIVTAIDKKEPVWVRGVALIALIGCQTFVLAIREWELRSLMYLLSFSLTLVALGVVRYAGISRPMISSEATA